MAAKSFDYSKWDKIELSDDESDLHPNIDKDSWFRLKHRTRLEREEKEDLEVKALKSQNEQDNTRRNLILARIKGVSCKDADADAEFEDVEALNVEAEELDDNIRKRTARIDEIAEKRKWNIDNICTVKEEKTIVNKVNSVSLKAEDTIPAASTESVHFDNSSIDETVKKDSVVNDNKKSGEESTSTVKSENVVNRAKSTVSVPTSSSSSSSNIVNRGSEPAATVFREKLAVMSYNDFVIQHERILEDYSEINDLEATKEFLFKHCDILLHEHSQSYMLLSSLEDEMNGKKKRMKLVCRQSQILSHVQELGVSMKRDPRDVVLPFFKRIEEKEYLKGFLNAVDDFILKIQKRSIEKRKEMDAEEMEENKNKVSLGPGGLDPYEVLNGLPITLREAFESQDLNRLQDVLASLDPKEAKYYMKQCVDSGLWVPKDSSVFEGDDEDDEENE